MNKRPATRVATVRNVYLSILIPPSLCINQKVNCEVIDRSIVRKDNYGNIKKEDFYYDCWSTGHEVRTVEEYASLL